MLGADMTFEKIVEKTKRMLGKNYRGDTEVVPVYSSLVTISGHTDAFLAISNGGFSDEEVALIKEKTNNYAWWVANKGYIVNSMTHKESPALIIYGSELGLPTPDVLNFNGLIDTNFYLPINRTDITGDVNDSSNHIYVQFFLEGEQRSYEIDMDGLNGGMIEIEGIPYRFFAGRLYPEDRVIIDENVIYPIYLISNLEYYSIPIVGGDAERLNGAHDTEPVERNNLEILEDVCEMVTHEAAQWTNRPANTNLMNDCWPAIVKCACIAYLNRGAEGLNSQSELGQQNVYNDWIALLHKQVTNRRYIM